MDYFLAVLFLIFSSFCKCLVDNKLNIDFLFRRSECTTCKKILTVIDLIPIFSYIFLGGKCRFCKVKIPKVLFYYELFALLIALSYLIFNTKFYFISYVDYWLILILIFIAIEDVLTYEINPKLQFLLLFFSIIKLSNNFEISQLHTIIVLILSYHILYILLHKGIGYGDIKLWSILALNLDLLEGLNIFLYTFIFGGFYAIYLLVTKQAKCKKEIPLAPFIALAYITILIIREITLW